MPTCCVGSATSIDGYGDARRHKRHGSGSSKDILGSWLTGPGSTCRPLPDDQDDKSRVTGDCYARICGSRRVRPPPATRQVDPLFVQLAAGHSWASTTATYTTVGADARNRMLRAALERAYQANH